MAKGKKKAPKDETKREKFKRIIELRVRKTLKSIRLVGNCSGSAYEYTPADVSIIIASIRKEIEQLEATYQSKGVSAIDFNLD